MKALPGKYNESRTQNMSGYLVCTQIYQISARVPSPEIISIAALKLRENGLVAFPTETVYGLGANALNDTAVGRIFEAKGRPFFDPLIVHIANRSDIENVAKSIPKIAYDLAEKFWPGPLTLVLKRLDRVAEKVSAGLGTVAVRMPDHQIPLDLIIAAGIPIAAPSANLFTRPSPTSAQHVLDDLDGHVDIILDGGPCPIGLESTVLDLTKKNPTILRPGGTPAEALREVIPDLLVPAQSLMHEETGSPTSPGLMLKHYSPKARFLLFTGGKEEPSSRLREIISNLLASGYKLGLMVTDRDFPAFTDLPIEIEKLGHEENLAEIGQNLFNKMRLLDKKKVDFILMRSLRTEGLGLAIRDRLFKAAEQQIIDLEEPVDIEKITLNLKHQKRT